MSHCSPPASKDFALKRDLATYLDFEFDTEQDLAVVPTAKDLVSEDVAWLGSRSGSPVQIFHELPGDDDWLSSSPSSPGDDLDFNDLPSDAFAAVFGAGDAMDRAAVGMLVADETDSPIENVCMEVPPPVVLATPTPKPIQMKPTAPKVIATVPSAAPKAKAAPVPTPEPEEPEEKVDANRWAHNSTERKRRCEIRRLFSDLRDLFPDLHGDDRVSNINTLSRAIQCVAELDRESMDQEIRLHQLRARNQALKEAATAQNGGVLPVRFSGNGPSQQQSITVQTVVTDTYPQTLETKEVRIGQSAEDLVALAAENPSLRRTLPLALRELLDHNSRGVYEAKPLPPRRPKTVVRAE